MREKNKQDLIKCVTFIILFFVINNILTFVLVPGATLTRWVLHDSIKEPYDIVFIGSSECSRGVNPDIINSILKCRSFNLGTTSTVYHGGIDASFYNLYDYHIPSTVVFFVGRTALTAEKNEAAQAFAINYPALSSLKAKKQYILSTINQEGEFNRLFPWTVYSYTSAKAIMENVSNKLFDKSYKEYDLEYIQGTSHGKWYSGNGFLGLKTIEGENIYKFNDISVSAASDIPNNDVGFQNQDVTFLNEKITALEEMVKLAQAKGSKVCIVTSPVPDIRMYNTNGYYAFSTQLRAYAVLWGADYIDSNMLRKEIYQPLKNGWYDSRHLNADGAEHYSNILAKILLKISQGEDISDLFYSDWESYLETMNYVIATFLTLDKSDLEIKASAFVAAGPDVQAEYKFVIVNSDGREQEVLQDFKKNAELTIPISAVQKNDAIRVYARAVGTTDIDQYRYDTIPLNN